MAKIQLIIDADDGDDLRTAMYGVLNHQNSYFTPQTGTNDVATNNEQVAGDVLAGAKRTRRTKEQIAADEAAAAAARGGTRDLAEQIAEVQAEETAVDLGLGDAPSQAMPTIDDVKAAMTAHMGKHSAKKTQDVLLATTGAGMISAIPAEKYAAAIAALQADMG